MITPMMTCTTPYITDNVYFIPAQIYPTSIISTVSLDNIINFIDIIYYVLTLPLHATHIMNIIYIVLYSSIRQGRTRDTRGTTADKGHTHAPHFPMTHSRHAQRAVTLPSRRLRPSFMGLLLCLHQTAGCRAGSGEDAARHEPERGLQRHGRRMGPLVAQPVGLWNQSSQLPSLFAARAIPVARPR